ncbi:MAG: cupin domain-containing protein [Methanomassiliicoccales archaeon]|jgi:quercetin dioxygenase-like cupin family protein|nr:cupin domain-containing protein [Methanomassiliicoccales archaeon]
MRLYRSSEADWEEGKGYRKRLLISEAQLGIEGSFMQEVAFRPGESVPMHYHMRTKEVFLPLDEAVFVINGESVTIGPGDVLVCEPGDRHGNPVIHKPFRILVLKVGFVPEDTVWL